MNIAEKSCIDLAVSALCQSMDTCGLPLSQQRSLRVQFQFDFEYALFGEMEREAVEESKTSVAQYSVPVL